jgi:hypothetical protein
MLVVLAGPVTGLGANVGRRAAGDRHRDAWGSFDCHRLPLPGATLLALLAPFWVPVLFPVSHQARQLTVKLTRIQLAGMVLNTSVSVMWSVCGEAEVLYASSLVMSPIATVSALALPVGRQAAAQFPPSRRQLRH